MSELLIPIKESFRFAFTVTLLPKLYKCDATQQYDNTFVEIFLKIKCMSSANQFVIVAELTKAFNIHYHGTIVMKLTKNCRKTFADSFRGSKLFGFVNIKEITEPEIWHDYIIKDLTTTRESINRPPIIYHDDTLHDLPSLTNLISSVSQCYEW